jgi:hypothetical protein
MSQGGPLGQIDLPPSVPTQIFCDVGVAIPTSNTLNVFGAGTTTTSGLGNTITITSTGGGYTWNVVTSALNPITLTAGNGYICKGLTPVQFVLPAAASVGDSYKIIGYSNLWTIAQNATQSITIGIVTSTIGIFGSVTATTVSDGLELICVTANTEFFEVGMQGNPSIV